MQQFCQLFGHFKANGPAVVLHVGNMLSWQVSQQFTKSFLGQACILPIDAQRFTRSQPGLRLPVPVRLLCIDKFFIRIGNDHQVIT